MMVYLVLKKISALLRGITSKHVGNFYGLNCLDSFRSKNRLESHQKVCENEDFCSILIPSEVTRKLTLINTKNLIRNHLLFMKILNL